MKFQELSRNFRNEAYIANIEIQLGTINARTATEVHKNKITFLCYLLEISKLSNLLYLTEREFNIIKACYEKTNDLS